MFRLQLKAAVWTREVALISRRKLEGYLDLVFLPHSYFNVFVVLSQAVQYSS
jgi:hypothetical protein